MDFEEDEHLEQSVIPLLDVLLVLVVILAISTGAVVRTAGVEDHLAFGTGSASDGSPRSILLLQSDGALTLDGKPIDWDEMIDTLRPRGQAPAAGLLVAIDKNAKYQSAIQLRTALSDAGCKYIEIVRTGDE